VNHQTRNPRGRTGRLLATSLAGTLLCGVGGILVADPAAAVTSVTAVEFSAIGAPQQWVVPAGVTSATFVLDGASGGQGGGTGTPAAPGPGGRLVATLPVVPGTTYTVVVGGRGQDFGPGGAGGYNGGGAGGTSGGQGNGPGIGGGGGGATDIRSGSGLESRLLVAGGGGGSSSAGSPGIGTAEPASPGGAGSGGSDATAGADTPNFGNFGGQAGSATAGGAGGAVIECCNPGAAGSAGTGGAGGDGTPGGGGGGGGGGWFGGGGGAGSATSTLAGGGGGGGSGHADSSATDVTASAGVHTGDGHVRITFETPAPSPTATPPSISGPVNNGVGLGASYSHQYTVTGSPTPELTVTGALPPGITLAQDGTLSGVPTTSGLFSFTITASNGTLPDATVADSLLVLDLSGLVTAPTIAGTPPNAQLGTYYDFAYTRGGSPWPSTAVTAGELPPGLELTSVGHLAGTPTEVGTWTFTITGDNGSGSVATLTSTVEVQAAPTVTGTPPAAVLGVPYSFSFTTTGTPAPEYTVVSGTLPAGLILSGGGVISGTPTAAGPGRPVTVQASNGVGNPATVTVTIPVSAPGPTISGTPPAAGVGEPYSFSFSTTGGPHVTRSAGSLPPGLSLSSSGRLSGTPTRAGTYAFTVRAAAGTAAPVTENVTLVVRPAPTVSVSCVLVTEGNSGTRPLTVTVALSRASSVPVSVRWTTANGTAVAGSDYVAASGTVSFAPGQTSKTVTVQVRGDRTHERDEYFLVRLASPSHATIDRGTAVATVRNDD
jgi:hypothetical protein